MAEPSDVDHLSTGNDLHKTSTKVRLPIDRPVTSHQRLMSAFRPFCGKTTCCWRRKSWSERGATAFLIKLFAFAAVQERA